MNRRNFIKGTATGLLIPFAPSIVRAELLMPAKATSTLSLDEIVEMYRSRMDEIVRQQCVELHQRIITITPVCMP